MPSIIPLHVATPGAPVEAPKSNVLAFLEDFAVIAPPVGRGHFRFCRADGTVLGFVQLICFERQVQIHRLWALQPGLGQGTAMLRTLCDLADRHGVELKLKVVPIGPKPYPLSREQLKAWYERFRFAGPRWHLVRKPLAPAPAPIN